MNRRIIIMTMSLAMILLVGCGQKPEKYGDKYSGTFDPMALNISDSIDESETIPVSTTTSEPTTTPEVTTTPEPTTTPEVTTTPDPTTTPTTTTTPMSTTAATTTTKSTTTQVTTTVSFITTAETTTTTSEPEPESYETETVTELYEPMSVEEMAQCFLELLNEERARVGAPELVTGPIIQKMALVRANELPILFSHRRPNGLGYDTVLTEYKYGIPTGYYGTYFNGEQYEIYYRGNTDETVGMMDSTYPEVMIEGFRNSPGHWVVLMDPTLGAVGVAVVAVEDRTYGYLYYYEVLLTDKLYE